MKSLFLLAVLGHSITGEQYGFLAAKNKGVIWEHREKGNLSNLQKIEEIW